MHTIFAIPIIITIIFIMWPGGGITKKYTCNAILTGAHLDNSKKIELEDKGKLNIKFLPMGEGIGKDLENASMQNILAATTAGDYDLIIMDKERFDVFAKQGTFLALDDLIKMNNLNDKSLKFLRVKAMSEKEEHIYGLELNENKCFQDGKYDVKNKVVGIYVNTKEMNRAVRFITFLFNDFTN